MKPSTEIDEEMKRLQLEKARLDLEEAQVRRRRRESVAAMHAKASAAGGTVLDLGRSAASATLGGFRRWGVFALKAAIIFLSVWGFAALLYTQVIKPEMERREAERALAARLVECKDARANLASCLANAREKGIGGFFVDSACGYTRAEVKWCQGQGRIPAEEEK